MRQKEKKEVVGGQEAYSSFNVWDLSFPFFLWILSFSPLLLRLSSLPLSSPRVSIVKDFTGNSLQLGSVCFLALADSASLSSWGWGLGDWQQRLWPDSKRLGSEAALHSLTLYPPLPHPQLSAFLFLIYMEGSCSSVGLTLFAQLC